MGIEVGNRIKLIRKKRGETLEQFGNAIGGVLKVTFLSGNVVNHYLIMNVLKR